MSPEECASQYKTQPVPSLGKDRGFRRQEEHPAGETHATTIMLVHQKRPDYAGASPVLSDAQMLDCLADPVRNMRARLQKIRIATLNIWTLTAKSREIADMMSRRNIDILCLQETRWTGGKSGGKARNIGDGIKLYYSGGTRPKNGVAICLKEEWQEKVIEVTRKSDRIMCMKLVTPRQTYNIVSTYAPQQGLDYARESDIALVNTFFTKSEAQTVTFKSGPNQTVVDYIGIRRESMSKVKDCKVIKGESVAAQHRLLLVDITVEKKKRRRRKREKKLVEGQERGRRRVDI